jgi:hypothetical protein
MLTLKSLERQAFYNSTIVIAKDEDIITFLDKAKSLVMPGTIPKLDALKADITGGVLDSTEALKQIAKLLELDSSMVDDMGTNPDDMAYQADKAENFEVIKKSPDTDNLDDEAVGPQEDLQSEPNQLSGLPGFKMEEANTNSLSHLLKISEDLNDVSDPAAIKDLIKKRKEKAVVDETATKTLEDTSTKLDEINTQLGAQ